MATPFPWKLAAMAIQNVRALKDQGMNNKSNAGILAVPDHVTDAVKDGGELGDGANKIEDKDEVLGVDGFSDANYEDEYEELSVDDAETEKEEEELNFVHAIRAKMKRQEEELLAVIGSAAWGVVELLEALGE